MNDTYVECMVSRKSNPLVPIVKYLLIIATVICVAGSLLIGYILLIPAIIFGCMAYFLMPMFDLEYEYLYLSKEITIDKIMAKERRKRAMTIDLNAAEVIARSTSHALDSYRNRNHAEKDFSSGTDAATYTIVSVDKETLTLIKFEPNAEMLDAIKQVFPRKVIEY